MIPFIIRRLLWMVVLLLVISFLTYVIFYTLPAADPAALRAGRQPSPELLDYARGHPEVHDLLSDETFRWRIGRNFVRLEPGQSHLIRIRR